MSVKWRIFVKLSSIKLMLILLTSILISCNVSEESTTGARDVFGSNSHDQQDDPISKLLNSFGLTSRERKAIGSLKDALINLKAVSFMTNEELKMYTYDQFYNLLTGFGKVFTKKIAGDIATIFETIDRVIKLIPIIKYDYERDKLSGLDLFKDAKISLKMLCDVPEDAHDNFNDHIADVKSGFEELYYCVNKSITIFNSDLFTKEEQRAIDCLRYMLDTNYLALKSLDIRNGVYGFFRRAVLDLLLSYPGGLTGLKGDLSPLVDTVDKFFEAQAAIEAIKTDDAKRKNLQVKLNSESVDYIFRSKDLFIEPSSGVVKFTRNEFTSKAFVDLCREFAVKFTQIKQKASGDKS